MQELQIYAADDVRENLSEAEVEAVLEGRAVSVDYRCQICQQPGDARIEASNVVLWVAADGDGLPPSAMLALVHAACGPSEIHLMEEWAAMPHDDSAFRPEKPLTLVGLTMDRNGEPWATLTLQPGTTQRCYGDGEVIGFEVVLQALLAEGWEDRLHDLPIVEGWDVQVEDGRLLAVRRQDHVYWKAPGSILLGDDWQQAAEERGEVLVVMLPPASLHGHGDYYDVLTALEDRGELAAARIILAAPEG